MNRENRISFILITILIGLVISGLLYFTILNWPGRYQATQITKDGVVILDTAKGHLWLYYGRIAEGVVTYHGKLKVGEKVPEVVRIKLKPK